MDSGHIVQPNQSLSPEQIEELYQQFTARIQMEEEHENTINLSHPDIIHTELKERNLMCKLDMKDVYVEAHIHPDSRCFLTFKHKNIAQKLIFWTSQFFFSAIIRVGEVLNL